MAETDPVRTEAVESQAGKLGHALQSLRWGPKGKAAQGSSAWPVSSLGSPIAVETRTASVLGQIFKISYSGRFSRLILVTPCFYPLDTLPSTQFQTLIRSGRISCKRNLTVLSMMSTGWPGAPRSSECLTFCGCSDLLPYMPQMPIPGPPSQGFWFCWWLEPKNPQNYFFFKN